MIQREIYNCTKVGKKVTITREIFTHRSSKTGEVHLNAASFDCDHKDACSVRTKSGSSYGYDYTKCVHPDLRLDD